MAACLRSAAGHCIDVIWLSGTLGGACSCSAHVHGGMFKTFGWTLHRRDMAVRYSGRSVQLFCSRSWAACSRRTVDHCIDVIWLSGTVKGQSRNDSSLLSPYHWAKLFKGGVAIVTVLLMRFAMICWSFLLHTSFGCEGVHLLFLTVWDEEVAR